jgi:hypothetical protein
MEEKKYPKITGYLLSLRAISAASNELRINHNAN